MRGSAALRMAVAPGGALAGPWIRNELWRRAQAVPSLDLRFAQNRSLVDATTGLDLVTFSRTSDATFVGSNGLIQTASAGTPRFDHNPVTGESLGLLVEESRTNLLLRSEEFDNASWTKQWSSVSSNATTAPNGALTADKLIEDSNNNIHAAYVFQTGLPAATALTLSVYAKASERTSFALDIRAIGSGFRAVFNLSAQTATGAAIGSGTLISASIQSAGDGWFRCSVTGSHPTDTALNTTMRLNNPAGTDTYTGDGTSGIYLWGVQLEVGSFPTSYIPTGASAVTRAADVCSISGSNFSSWYRQDEGTVFADCIIAVPASGNNQFLFRASDNGYNNSFALNIQSGGFGSIATSAGGVFDGVAASPLALTANAISRLAGAYAVNNLAVSLNGGTINSDTSATMPTALTRADIGSDHLGLNRIRAGHIRRLTYWPQALPSRLQAITQ